MHVKEYFENILHFEDITEEQVTIFLVLSPIWKLLILEKIYEEVDWRVPEPKEILDVEKKVEIYENINDDEVLVVGNEDLVSPEIEAEKENERFKASKRRRSMKDDYLNRDYKKGVDNRKIRAEKIEKI
jgi:hypothetical protein